MAPLKGNTLGEKHRTYNAILKELIAQGPAELPKINYNENDVENMMKIDIACNDRNVDYIMEVFKCGDMLYVTRAIKRSVWLITEPEYAHLINPDYLDSKVFPEMTTKAITKLMLHIRRYLKDEKRTEHFFYSVEKKNPNMALKWLENCSLIFIEEMVARYADSISSEILSRLCRKSISILQIYTNNISNQRYVKFEKVMFLLKSNTEEFLNITERLRWNCLKPSFDGKQTQILMKHSFQRIHSNFVDFQDRIDLSTFVKYLIKNNIDITTFLVTRCRRYWFKFDNLRPFLVVLDQEGTVDLLRKLHGIANNSNASDSSHDTETDNDGGASQNSNVENASTNDSSDAELTELEELFYAIEPDYSELSQVYRWYEFTPFETAFADLSKLIHDESSAEERHSLLTVLLKNARKNMELVRKVLKFYLDHHINEPYIHKIRFVNSVLSQHDAFRFDEATWHILNKIFQKCHVYIQSLNKIQQCLDTIIIRSVLLGLPVHEIVEQKFIFHTLKDVKNKLDNTEKEKLFHYLYDQLVRKLDNQEINTEAGIKHAVTILVNAWILIKDWEKEETHHKFVIDNMIRLSNLSKQLSGDKMTFLYCSMKPYHRQLFESSLLLYPCENMCINALKHDASLLERYRAEVAALCSNDNVSLKTFLSKLRIYWPDSMASEWRCTLMDHLQEVSGHKALVRNIYFLSPQQLLLDFIKKYAPSDNKIQWSEDILIEVNLRKHIAKWMHLARPQLPVEVVLWYAKGDYLQFTQLSLNSIYYNLRSKDIENHIKLLLKSPVSLQKHGIRLASKRMKPDELLQTFPSIWKSTRNSSIRAHIFTSAFKILCDADDVLVSDSWEVLRFMIDNLNYAENKKIYMTLGEVKVVPRSVIGEYFEKSFIFLKDLPDIFYGVIDIDDFIQYATDVMQYLDPVFVENTLLVSVYDIFSQEDHKLLNILSAYLLCSKDETTQMQKYKNLIEPLFEICGPKWKVNEFESNVIDNFQKFLTSSANYLQRFLFELNIIMPVKMFTHILSILESELCKEEMYRVLTRWRLSIAYLQLLNDNKVTTEGFVHIQNWEEISKSSVEKYAEICIKYLEEDIESNFPSIYVLFACELKQVCKDFDIKTNTFLELLNSMLVHKKLQVYMLVLNLLQHKFFGDDESRYMEQVIKKQLYCFPSKELKIHYISQYGHKFDDCEFEDSDNSDNSTSSSEGNLSDIEEESVEDTRTCNVL